MQQADTEGFGGIEGFAMAQAPDPNGLPEAVRDKVLARVARQKAEAAKKAQ